MTKSELKKEILELLGGDALGMTKSRMADILNVSRPTVSKYVDMLHEEGKIKEMAVGDFKFWALAKKRDNRDSALKMTFRLMMNLALELLAKYTGKEVDWKEFGYFIGENFNLKNFIQTDFFYDLIFDRPGDSSENIDEGTLPDNNDVLLARMGKIFLEVFKAIVSIFDDCTIDEPIIIQDPPIITLRLHESLFDEYENILEIASGLVEKKMQTDFYNIKVSIDFNAPPKTDILDIIIKIQNLDEIMAVIKKENKR